MEKSKPHFQKYVFVCENQREEGRECCGQKGQAIRELLKNEIKSLGLAHLVRVSRAGCLDVCSEGPNVLVEPDDVWFKQVSETDVPQIVKAVVENLNK